MDQHNRSVVDNARNVEVSVYRKRVTRFLRDERFNKSMEEIARTHCCVMYQYALREGEDKRAFIRELQQAEHALLIRSYQFYTSTSKSQKPRKERTHDRAKR
jgi:hypothetical protein